MELALVIFALVGLSGIVYALWWYTEGRKGGWK